MDKFLQLGTADWQRILGSDFDTILFINKLYLQCYIVSPDKLIEEYKNCDINVIMALNSRENKLLHKDFQQTTLILKLPQYIQREVFAYFCADYISFDEFPSFCNLAIQIKKNRPKKWKLLWQDRLRAHERPHYSEIISRKYSNYSIFDKIKIILELKNNKNNDAVPIYIFSMFEPHLYDGIFVLLWELKLPPNFAVPTEPL